MGHKVQYSFVTPQAIQAWCMAIVGTAIRIFPKLLPYFRPKYASFPHLFQTWTICSQEMNDKKRIKYSSGRATTFLKKFLRAYDEIKFFSIFWYRYSFNNFTQEFRFCFKSVCQFFFLAEITNQPPQKSIVTTNNQPHNSGEYDTPCLLGDLFWLVFKVTLI